MLKDPCVSVTRIQWSSDGSMFGKLIDNGTLTLQFLLLIKLNFSLLSKGLHIQSILYNYTPMVVPLMFSQNWRYVVEYFLFVQYLCLSLCTSLISGI